MLGFLAGLPGKIKILTDRLSSTRATGLDNLINGTFPLRAYYTDERAAYLDLIPGIGSSVINSIQTGEIMIVNGSTFTDVTITAVNTAKSICLHGGNVATQLIDGYGAVYLRNATTVRAYRGGAQADFWIRYTVLEFK
jgi:hypothetical protein